MCAQPCEIIITASVRPVSQASHGHDMSHVCKFMEIVFESKMGSAAFELSPVFIGSGCSLEAAALQWFPYVLIYLASVSIHNNWWGTAACNEQLTAQSLVTSSCFD